MEGRGMVRGCRACAGRRGVGGGGRGKRASARQRLQGRSHQEHERTGRPGRRLHDRDRQNCKGISIAVSASSMKRPPSCPRIRRSTISASTFTATEATTQPHLPTSTGARGFFLCKQVRKMFANEPQSRGYCRRNLSRKFTEDAYRGYFVEGYFAIPVWVS